MILITKVNNYKEINKDLLFLIDKIPKTSINEKEQSISNTDWTLPINFRREYLDYFYKIITPYMEKIAVNLNSKKWSIDNTWFQQYTKSNSHGWHNHTKTNFTNVYFVELPFKNLGTEILDHKDLNLKEGDLLTFSAHLYHRSPENFTNKRKTVISFNSNFYDYERN